MTAQPFQQDQADPTKKLALDVAEIATGTTRTITVADRDIRLDVASNTHDGFIQAGVIHPSSPSSTLPTSALRVGQLFIRDGGTAPGVYTALDTVGNWRGPL